VLGKMAIDFGSDLAYRFVQKNFDSGVDGEAASL
jgi:hypothetical protein